MKNEKLLHSIGNIADKFIEEASPHHGASTNHKAPRPKRAIFRYIPLAACLAIFLIGATAFAANYIQNSLSSFYLRFISTQEMAVADSAAEHFGVKVYFDALKTDDWYNQYFAINKLVEYYNDETVRPQAVRAIIPFLTNEDEKLADAAAFALSVLNKEFDDPLIIHLSDGTIIFTLFNDYSDYGTYNQIWMIKDDELSVFMTFDRPHMYIREIIPSPDSKLLAVKLISNKSGYLVIYDVENHMASPELIDSARFMVAHDLGYTLWQRMDYENYSGAWDIEWIDNDTIQFAASLTYDGAELGEEAIFAFNFRQKHMEYEISHE